MTSLTSVGTRRLRRVPAAVRLQARAGLAALVGALVLGIVGMHALADHGTPAPVAAAVPADAPSTAMTGMSHDAATASGPSHEGHDQGAAAASGMPAGSGHDMTSMVMLCVVMLAAAAITLLALLAVRVLRPLLPDAFAPAPVRVRTLPWVRGAGPPPVWQFSVIRC